MRLINSGTNQAREAITDDNGNFIFNSVPGGTYSINVKKEGFQAFQTSGVRNSVWNAFQLLESPECATPDRLGIQITSVR